MLVRARSIGFGGRFPHVFQDLPELYRTIGDRFAKLDTWSMYLITSYEDAQNAIGKKADKNRKIYNGMIKTYYYQYIGPKPPRREQRTSEI